MHSITYIEKYSIGLYIQKFKSYIAKIFDLIINSKVTLPKSQMSFDQLFIQTQKFNFAVTLGLFVVMVFKKSAENQYFPTHAFEAYVSILVPFIWVRAPPKMRGFLR